MKELPRETLLRNMINKAYIDSVDNAMKTYQKTSAGKRVSDSNMRRIIVAAITTYKIGIMGALKLNEISKDLEEKSDE